MSAALSSDGSKCVVVDARENLFAFDVATRQIRPTGVTGAWPVRYSMDGKYLALRSNDSGGKEQLRLVKADKTFTVRDLDEFRTVAHIKATPDGRFLVTGAGHGAGSVGLLCAADTGQIEEVYRMEEYGRRRTDFDAKRLVGVSTDHRLVTQVIDLRTNAVLGSVDNSANRWPIIMTYTLRDIYESLDKIALVAVVICGLVWWTVARRRRARQALPS
jgi:hypothetical protein